MKEALKVIAGFPNQDAMFVYCEAHKIGFNKLEPPYLTMARIADFAIKGIEDDMG